MPNYTDFLHLEKPLQAEQYNVDVFNDNCDKIDNFAQQIPPRAYTADKLTTGVNINGVFFRGDTDVVTGLGKHDSTVTYNEENIAYKIIDGEAIIKRCLNDETTGDNFNDPTKWLNAINIKGLTFKQISNCILEAPNGTYSISGRTISLKEGLKVLIADGRNADGTLKNIEYTLSADVSADYSSFAAGQRRLVFLANDGTISQAQERYILGYYRYKSSLPATMETSTTYYAYAEYENYWYSTSGSTTANWQPVSVIPIVSIYTTSSSLQAFIVYSAPVKIVDSNMTDGRWTYKKTTLNSSNAYGTYDIDLSATLPRDQFRYECIFKYYISRTDTNNGNSYYGAAIDGVTVANGFVEGGTSSTDNRADYGQFTGIVGGERSMSITISRSGTGTPNLQEQSTSLIAYRRLGNNG